MNPNSNTHYSNSNILFKILAFACFPAIAFVILNYVLVEIMEYYPQNYIRELNLIIQNGLPLFLFLIGTSIRNKTFRIPITVFLAVFTIAYTLKTLDFFGLIDIRVKWILCPSLVGLVITYVIYFFTKTTKIFLDYLKVIWFLLLSYVLLSVYFPIGFKTIYLFQTSYFVMLLLMTMGLINYFRKSDLRL